MFVVFVVCNGNLKYIKGWVDLMCKGIDVVIFNLFSLGLVKWNVLVVYGV